MLKDVDMPMVVLLSPAEVVVVVGTIVTGVVIPLIDVDLEMVLLVTNVIDALSVGWVLLSIVLTADWLEVAVDSD